MANSTRSVGFFSLWNMSFGFLGIQFGWGLQMANMSAIYEYLGADAHQIPMLWLAAPLTGLIVQPIIGYMSDRTWGPLGRRRPYFLVGAITSSIALVLMPNASALWMAAGLLWMLDASVNISMEPFRAFVADLLPPEERTRGFAMQSVFIGVGAIAASALPFVLSRGFGFTDDGSGAIPFTVRVSFYAGAAVFLFAVLWTVITTREHPPADLEAFEAEKRESRGAMNGLREIVGALRNMPLTMRRLASVQVFTWLGLFCMWLYFPVAVARNVYGAREATPRYLEGIEWAGLCLAASSLVTFFYSMLLPAIARRIGRRATHSVSLCAGAAGLMSVGFIHDPVWLLASMVGVGIAWASVLAMPYAMLADVLPEGKLGVYMGIFNFFIVLPEIAVALCFGPFMEHVLLNNRVAAVMLGGVCFFVAAVLTWRVREQRDPVPAHDMATVAS
ncbi:MAG: MFS transporter [Myxococcota bacterium]